MACSEKDLYPFILLTDDDDAFSNPVDSNDACNILFDNNNARSIPVDNSDAFSTSVHNSDAFSIPVDNNDEPIPNTDDDNNHLMSHIESKITTIAASEAEKVNLHKDAVYGRIPPIDVLIFGRAGVGKSCLLRAITDDPDILASPQLDHATLKLQFFTKNLGKLTFRFWDTRGIDSWSGSNDVMNMLLEIEESKIQPLFVIYCSSGNGRVNSEIVTKILNHLKGTKTPIAYVITNIYSHNNQQLQGQFDGGLSIMEEIYFKKPVRKNKYFYEFDVLIDDIGNIIRDGKGSLIGVNSEPYINDLTNTNKPKLNIFELMSFIANNLDDEDFARFIALTLKNRGFWEQITDNIVTKLYRCRDQLTKYGIKFRDFIWDKWNNLLQPINTN